MNKDAYDALNRAIAMLIADCAPEGQIVTDAVLVVGCQGISDCGHRVGSIGVFMKDGVQPAWVTRSLLREGLDAVRNTSAAYDEDECSEPEGT